MARTDRQPAVPARHAVRRRRPAHRRRYPRPATRSRWTAGVAVVVVACLAWGVVTSSGSERDAGFTTTTVVVRPGDTLSAIAARYGTTVAALAALNHLSDPDMVRAGTTLEIPVPAAPP
ncbi:MAG TPA: LysM domain-containing protein, partial [Acidimicrobiales bacterium]|nr:LysM domain-containing protein [Acidimicrobiales bacterium]